MAPFSADSTTAHEATIRACAARYDDPARHYHSRAHIDEMLHALRLLTGEVLHPALELAAWAHDAVYDPRAAAGENERASASLARDLLDDDDTPRRLTEEVVTLTLATIDHAVATTAEEPDETESADGDARCARLDAFLDADLWILGAPWPRFVEYGEQIRAEYSFVPDDVYTLGRAAVLQRFADRDWIYRTAFARQEWEPSARSNLARIGHHGRAPQRASTAESSNQPRS